MHTTVDDKTTPREKGLQPENDPQPKKRDSDSAGEAEATSAAPGFSLGCRVEFAAALCDLVGTCQVVQGVWEDTDRDMAMVRLDAEAHQVELVDGDVKRFQAVWLVVVPIIELRLAAVAASRAEDASANGGLDADAVAAVLERVGLGDRTHHYPAQLSGGEQQRVGLARAFANRPKILMADEPTGNLDADTGGNVIDLMVKLNREEGTTLVLVTHDVDLASEAHRIVRLSGGRVVSDEQVTPR